MHSQMTIGERLKSVVKNKKLKLTEFARKSGIPYRTLQGYVADQIVPGGESLIKIHTELGVSMEWLLMGQGEMYQTKSKSSNTNESELIPDWLKKWWEEADDKHRIWLEVQLKRCFPEYAQWIEKHSEKE